MRCSGLPIVVYIVDSRGKLVGLVTMGDMLKAEPSPVSTLSVFEIASLLEKVTMDKIITYVADRYASELGLSVGQGPNAKLYPFDILLEKPVVNDEVGPFHVVVVMDTVNKQAMAFSRKVSGRVLTFKPITGTDDATLIMRDQETGSVWNRVSGRAIEGPLKGAEVLPLISVPWLKDRWRDIHDDGAEYQGS